MKYSILFNNFLPCKKCGMDPISALITSGGQIVSSGISASQSASNVESQLAAQKEENQLNRDWQTQEAEKARGFTTSERIAQQGYQTSERNAAFEQSKEMAGLNAYYNSPVYQSQQLKQANINPAVYFGQQSSFSGSSMSGPNGGSAPSGASSPMPAGVSGLSPVSYQPFQLDLGNLASGLASAIKSSAEAKKLGIETDWLPNQIREQLRNLKADSDLKEMQKALTAVDVAFRQQSMPYQLQMAEKSVREAVSRIELNEQQKLTQKSAESLNFALEKLQSAMTKLTDSQRQRLGIEIMFLPQTLKSIIANNTASASLASAQASTENLLRDFRASILETDANISQDTYQKKVAALRSQLEKESFQSQADKQEALRRLDYLQQLHLDRDKTGVGRIIDNTLMYIGEILGTPLKGLFK